MNARPHSQQAPGEQKSCTSRKHLFGTERYLPVRGVSRCDGGQMPSDHEAARRWQQLAEEASSIAREMNDPEAIHIMRRIVQGYEILAEHARRRAHGNKSSDRKSD